MPDGLGKGVDSESDVVSHTAEVSDKLFRQSSFWLIVLLLSTTVLFLCGFFSRLSMHHAHQERVAGLIAEHVQEQSETYVRRKDLLALGAYYQSVVRNYPELDAVVLSEASGQILGRAGKAHGSANVSVYLNDDATSAKKSVQIWLNTQGTIRYVDLFFAWLASCFFVLSLWKVLKNLRDSVARGQAESVRLQKQWREKERELTPSVFDVPMVNNVSFGTSATGANDTAEVGRMVEIGASDSETVQLDDDVESKPRPIHIFLQTDNLAKLTRILAADVMIELVAKYTAIMEGVAALYQGEVRAVADGLWLIEIPFINNESESVAKALYCSELFLAVCQEQETAQKFSDAFKPSLNFHALINNLDNADLTVDDFSYAANTLLLHVALCDWQYVNERINMLDDEIDWHGMGYIPCQLKSRYKSLIVNQAKQVIVYA